MVRQIAPRGAQALRPFHPGAHLCRGPGAELPAQCRPTLAGGLAGGCPRRNLGRIRHRGHALLRPDACQDHRARRHPRRSRSENAHRPGRHAHLRHRNQSRLPAPGLRASRLRRRRHLHAVPARFSLPPRCHRSARPRHPDHRAGLPRPPGLLARGRASLRPHGFALLPPGQPPGGQSGTRRGPGNHRHRPHPPLHLRHHHRAHRRQAPRAALPGHPGAGRRDAGTRHHRRPWSPRLPGHRRRLSTSRNISAAAPPSSWANSAAPSGRATCWPSPRRSPRRPKRFRRR